MLLRAGLRVVERRFRCRAGEVDLVALDGATVVFVEVKARAGDGFGQPAEAVHSGKRRRLAAAALHYLRARSWTERICRFDVVEVWSGPGGLTARHIEDAFRITRTG